jgi:predicted AAA+ superfamily ATPase
MINRQIKSKILAEFKNGFVTIIYGPRRVGKTILLEQIREALLEKEIIVFNGDTQEAIEALATNSEVRLSNLVKNYEVIFIDEAQRIPNIMLALKIIIDKFPEKKIIVTGSSSLQLSSGAKENLTGRNISYLLYPLSTKELQQDLADYQATAFLEEQLIFGGYPYLYSLSSRTEKENYLLQIVEDYLFKDIMMLERLDYPEAFKKLAILLAFQIGHEVSLNELSIALGIEIKTVSRYLDLLEKSFVVFHLDAYSTNLRNEINKKKKYYFYDLGIRNALIGQFQNLANRIDVGQLWENFLLVERKKKEAVEGVNKRHYFWRNYLGAEVDFIEIDGENIMTAFEFKWKKDRVKTPKNFFDNYGVSVKIVNQENYLEFVK